MGKQYISITDRKSSRKGSFFLHVDTWNLSVQVVIGHHTDHVRKIVLRRFPDADTSMLVGVEQENCPAGRVISKGSESVMLLKFWPEKIYDYAVVAHEVFHIADHCLRGKGIVLSDDSDEAYAYLIEDLTRRIMVKVSEPEKRKRTR